MKRLLPLFLTIILCTVSAMAQFNVHHYSVEDGLSQNTIMSITQDRDGYMWFGTWDGLNKFDGYRFTTFKSHPGEAEFRNNRVEYIREDSEGYIWFQTYDGRLHRFDKAREKFYTVRHASPFIRYNADRMFIEPQKGELYLVCENGVMHLSEKTDGNISEQLFSMRGRSRAHFILSDNNGYVWYDDSGSLVKRSILGTDSSFITLPSADRSVTLTTATLSSDGLWFASDCGMMWRYSLSENRIEPVSILPDAEITSIVQISGHEFLVGTHAHGLCLYNTLSAQLSRIADANRIGHVISLVNDSLGTVWVETDHTGIWRYRLADMSLKHLQQDIDIRYAPLRANLIILEDKDHNIWVNPFGGGFSKYDREADRLINPFTGLTNMVHAAFIDRQGELWLSTYQTGIDCLNLRQQQFRLHDMRRSNRDIGEVRAMLQLNSGEVLFSTKDQKILTADRKEIPVTGSADADLSLYCFMQDTDGSLLLGTRYDGLFRLEGRRLTNIGTAGDGTALNCNAVYDMLLTADSTLYIGTYEGGVNILKDNSFINSGNIWQDYPAQQCSRVRCLMSLADTMILAGTTNGLLQIRHRDRKTWFTPYSDIHCLLRDSRGDIWMGSFSGGLCKVLSLADDTRPAQFLPYTVHNGLRSDIVLSLAEDRSGRLWFASENNITQFNPVTGTFQHFTPFFNSIEGCFTESKALMLKSGDILFGYNNGYCAFTPERILRSEDVPQLHFTDFQLFNSEVVLGDEDSPLKTSIGTTDEITLSHDQSVWSIEYAAIDFFNADKIEYAFILDGFDKEWNYVHNQRRTTYTNLPAGHYTFRVRSTNAEGAWVDNERTLSVHILPSFWHTGWAILIYLLIAALILFVTYLIVSRYNRLQQQMLVEQQVTDFRLKFFTNISHELRTPLTLISSPVDNILKTEKLSNNVKTQLEIVQSNARRMLRLINEILDFRKIQNKKMRLHIQQTPLARLVEETCSNFNKEAFDKHINFRLDNQAPDAVVWVDREKTDIILYNLLSNAFKFTPAGKSITVSLSEKPNFVLLKVADEGVGIPREKRSIMFERFSSHDQIENLAGKVGTGIGLNLVKELVDLHKGYIEVESEVGKGTTFTVMFRTGKEHFGNEVDFVGTNEVRQHKHDVVQQPKLDNVVVKQNLPRMLVVEDNQDMLTFLSNIFSRQFFIDTAKDGNEGLQRVREAAPDIVITDLMMPNMDGLELTNYIKKELATSHIPVILLTAKEAIESRLDAMHAGADDYITKPFSAEYLQARVSNLLEQRERLRERYRNDLLTLQTAPLAREKTPDEVFLAKLLDFMERNMDNNELIVEDMVSDMAMGRTVFFNKLKNLTGLSPVEFIREVRIKRAAQLLETGTYNVTEVTYMVGMNDSRYFSKCFKAVYGITPTEYKRLKTEQQ